jgi:hypothetical protein
MESAETKMILFLNHIIDQAVPFVIGNAAQTESDYLIENRIVGKAFLDVYYDIMQSIFSFGIETNVFDMENIDFTINFIFGMMLECMVMVRKMKEKNKIIEVKNALVKSILKVIKK